MSNPFHRPASIRASDAAKRATTPMKFSIPPNDGGGDAHLQFGTTQREFNQPKLSPREKARRNVLTHTLQMPLVVTPLQPSAARPADQVERAVRLAATQRQGSLPSPLPGAWTSVHRVGSGAPPEPVSSRPAAARSTDPMSFGGSRRDSRPDDVRAEPANVHPGMQDHPAYARPHAVSPMSAMSAASMQDSGWTQLRTGDYDRVTLPGDAVRIPELSGREWMFIALLACASAATLYSLMVDDLTPASAEEDSVEAATTIEHEHLVRPALPNTAAQQPSAAAASAASAAAAGMTEIVSEPSSAEIVVGGAVIGNTPAKVVRGATDADYLLRKQGYEPQLVRITPNSPRAIVITLHPK